MIDPSLAATPLTLVRGQGEVIGAVEEIRSRDEVGRVENDDMWPLSILPSAH